jgi:pimeloyl-ACP methyl ester carboxylesterase
LLRPCADRFGPGAECGSIAVLEDRSRPNGRKIAIAFVVLRAPTKSPEPVFLFAGGPGQGSTSLADLATGPFAPVRKIRDVVLVDQRGTGGSNPLLCPTDVGTNPAGAFGAVFASAVFRKCRVDLSDRADLAHYLTDLAVQDVDAIRAILGYGRVLLWGGSYGTRMAQAYLRRYPERVVAMVLDGVVPFSFRAPSGYAASLQQSVDRVLADCRTTPTCRDSFPDLDARFAGLVARLRNGPVAARVRTADGRLSPVVVGLGDFGYAIRGVLYSAGGAREVPGLIHRAAVSGDLSEFAQRYWQRAADFGDFADGLHLSIFCAEDVPHIRDEEIPALAGAAFLGRYLIDDYRTACAEWVRAPVDELIFRPATARVPTLVVSGWFDPVTPPETGALVARHLPVSRHLVVRNQAHGAGFGCARPAVIYVLTQGTLDGLPEVCQSVTNLWSPQADR